MMKNLQAFITVLFTILMIGAGAANAATWTVTKSTNSSDGACDADCSLREAVAAAETGDLIVFSGNLAGQIFTLGGAEIIVTKRITINGFLNDQSAVILSGELTSRIFFVDENAGLDLRNMTLTQGNGVSEFASGFGGAIYADTNSVVSLDRVSVRNNQTIETGAILFAGTTGRITNSSFTENSAPDCPAIRNGGSNLYMANVTVGGNFDSDGGTGRGGVCNFGGDVFIRNSTIAFNLGSSLGGGIYNASLGNVNIGNTIVAHNQAAEGADIYVETQSSIVSVGGNLIGDTDTVPVGTFSQAGDATGINPLLAAKNVFYAVGSPISYYPLQAGSPARNAGLNQNAVEPQSNQPLTTDVRGAGSPRISAGTVDKGSYEDLTGNTSLIVTKLNDTSDNVCDWNCSLRDAVFQAGVNPGTDTITFMEGLNGTMPFSADNGVIKIQNQSVNIAGRAQAASLVISAHGTSTIFNLTNSTVSISGMTLTGGKSRIINEVGGGAISGFNSNLTLDTVMITGNDSIAYGAIYLNGGSAQRIVNSTISGNTADFCVGIGIENTTLFMANATVSGNSITNGGTGLGAIYGTDATLNIRNSTIAFNRIATGTNAGIKLNNSALNIGNSIVAKNLAGTNPDIEVQTGSVDSFGGNSIGSVSGLLAFAFNETNDIINVDPLLGALGDNGGGVTTHSLLPNSPAINGGLNAVALDPFDNSPLSTDARGTGFSRIQNSVVEKGAFELLAPTAASVSISGTVTNGKSGIARASVLLTSSNGETRTVKTNSFGYFKLDGVPAGEIYIVNVYSKGLTFAPQIVPVNENVSDLIFIPEE